MRIYVGNLSYQATEQELRDSFEPHGEVEETYIVRDRDTGRSRGFAFVEMPTDEEAKAAIEVLNGREVGGRTLTVNEARPRQERTRPDSPEGSSAFPRPRTRDWPESRKRAAGRP